MSPTPRMLAALLLGISLATACGGSEDAAALDLPGTSWTLDEESLDVDVPEQVDVTISFSDEVVSGVAGCNNYTGSYTLEADGAMAFGPLATTRKACVPEVAVVESAVLERLGSVASVESDGGELRLLDADDAVLLRFRPAP